MNGILIPYVHVKAFKSSGRKPLRQTPPASEDQFVPRTTANGSGLAHGASSRTWLKDRRSLLRDAQLLGRIEARRQGYTISTHAFLIRSRVFLNFAINFKNGSCDPTDASTIPISITDSARDS